MDKLNELYLNSQKKNPRGRPRQFDDEQIQEIRLDPRPLWEIAAEYRVSVGAISCIKNKITYDDVEGETRIAPPGPRPKLSDADIDAIRASDESNKTLAEKYKVSAQRIWQIRKNWKPGSQVPVAVVDGQLVVRGRRRFTEAETREVLGLLGNKNRVILNQRKQEEEAGN